MKEHFWFGRPIDDTEMDAELDRLEAHLAATLSRPFPFGDFIAAAVALSEGLREGREIYEKLFALAAAGTPPEDVKAMLAAMSETLTRKSVMGKIRSELGTSRPGMLTRKYPGRQFESWMPLGCVVHVMPSNVFSVAALGLMEGLMAGNLNIVKVSARDTAFAAVFAEELCRLDPGGRLREYIAVARIPSQDQGRLQRIFQHADGISAWGGESAIAAVRQAAPAGVRLISWGHKVSFGYIAADKADEAALEGMAKDVCRLDQQACSSPQTVFVEVDDDPGRALDFARKLAGKLQVVSPAIPGQAPDASEQAEITSVVSVNRAEEALGLTETFEDADGSWRVLYDARPGLRPSPLYRTIWVKPILRKDITAVLRPMRSWLQSCGLSCGLKSLACLSRAFFGAGVTRICRPGEMVDSYLGAPHDGVYALQQLSRRVSLDGPEEAEGIGDFSELEGTDPHGASPEKPEILTKSRFQHQSSSVRDADLVFRSGGSSGSTVYSTFSWDDYHDQMRCAAHGLTAAGLHPAGDRVINLFAAGHLYGSFVSFWTILEFLRVPQLPMGLIDDYGEIAGAIEDNDVNVIVGAPSHILGLYSACGERLKGRIEKIFFGGEKMTRAQRSYLSEEFGVSVIRSAAYGSNDAGPMGYQCPHCEGGVHHLMSAIQRLEIVDLESDTPVAEGRSGRLIFTSTAREYPPVIRYEIGDSGAWVAGECPCGRKDPRFDLQGRIGDVFKAGGPFFNYRRFVDILDNKLGYTGPVQIHLSEEDHHTVLELRIRAGDDVPESAESTVLENYGELAYAAGSGLAFKFRIRRTGEEEIEKVAASGKIKPICDHR